MTLLLLAPNAEVLSPVRQGNRELGTVLVCSLSDNALRALATARAEWEAAPWCPLVVVSESQCDSAYIRFLVPRACSVGVAVVGATAEPSVSDVRRALCGRGRIFGKLFAAYVALRTEMALEKPLRACLSNEIGADFTSSRLRRRLKQVGPYTQRDWANLFALCGALGQSAESETATQERIALELNMAPRTLSVWTRDYLQTNWRLAVGLGAWEPVLELALRVGGYVSAEAGKGISGRKRRVSGPQLRL